MFNVFCLVGNCCLAGVCCEYNFGMVNIDFKGVDDFVCILLFDYFILMDIGRVGKGVGVNDGFIGLYGYVYMFVYEVVCGIDEFGVNIVEVG